MNFKELVGTNPQLVTAICPIGAGFPVTVDVNKYVGECYRRMSRTYKEGAEKYDSLRAAPLPDKVKTLAEVVAQYESTLEVSAISADLHRKVHADVLACDRYGILDSWVLDDGTQPTFENLMQLDLPKLQFLFDWGRGLELPKEDGTSTQTQPSQMTSETISDGSSDPTTLLPASPTT